MTRFSFWAVIVALVTLRGPHVPPAAAPLVVHEWGTITTRHAANGTPEGRLNRIAPTEVLPAFVHRYEPPVTRDNPHQSPTKSPLTPGRPDVTMRLETPVIYFHPPSGSAALPPFDVSVDFRGGVLNEYYPSAAPAIAVDVDRIRTKMQAGVLKTWDGAVLDNYVLGSLRWTGVSLKETVRLPKTTSHVWLAPRAVKSAGVSLSSGEGERYLFYRGVAHLDALLQTELGRTDVLLRAPQRLIWMRAPSMTIPHVWLVDIRGDGRVAFRERTSLVIAKDSVSREVARLPLFAAADYSASGVAQLRRSMKRALIDAGLFEDEAEAMLATWRDSYFGSPGLRIFYLVPNEWTSYFLPLRISVPSQLTRVLVGRIDLASR
jgi:hypothetical protein